MDGNGEVGFSDFLVFASAFGNAVSSPGNGGGGSETVVVIPDANLRAVIADNLRKGPNTPITRAELASFTVLKAPYSGIVNLTGLEFATGLRSVNLEGNSISDLAPIANLTELEHLGLNNNVISDLAPIANLTRLTRLYLGNNAISDLAPIANLTGLEYLYLWDNAISDIAPLVANAGLDSGDGVYLQGNPLSDLSLNTYIPALRARGVDVRFGASKPAVDEQAQHLPRARVKPFGVAEWEARMHIDRRRMGTGTHGWRGGEVRSHGRQGRAAMGLKG